MNFEQYKNLVPEYILRLLVEIGFLASGYRIKTEAEKICCFLQNTTGSNHAYPSLGLALLSINQRDYVKATKILLQASRFEKMPKPAIATIYSFLALVFLLRNMVYKSHYYAKLAIDNSNDAPVINLAQACLKGNSNNLFRGHDYVE